MFKLVLILFIGVVILKCNCNLKEPEYSVEAEQTYVKITCNETGKTVRVPHEDLNDWFIEDNF